MSKQDRQGVRTPADVERKYNLGQLAAARGESQKQELAIAQLTQTVNQYIASNNGNIENLNNELDKLNEDVNGNFEELNKDIEELNKKIEELPDNPGGGGGSGFSPKVDVTEIEGGHKVTITDAEGTESFDVMDGKDGAKGDKGDKGEDGSDATVTKANVISALGYTPADASLFVEDTTYPGCYYRMVDGEKEWLNPPMVAGVEYRTTKRYEGNVVYTKKINYGNLPATSSKNVNIGVTCTKIASIYVLIDNGTYLTSLPFIGSSGSPMARFLVGTSFSIQTYADYSAYSARVFVEYFK